MKSEQYALIGHPLSHSLSPLIHEKLFALTKRNAEYYLRSLDKEQLHASMPQLLALNGFNVTIPYKVEILSFLDEISPKASLYHSVNTVCCTNGHYVGHNTDVFGFLQGIKSLGCDIANGSVLLLGAGGSANMIATETVLRHSPLTIAVRPQSLHKAQSLKSRLLEIVPTATVEVVDITQITHSYHLLINATPVGMYPNMGVSPVGENVIANCAYIYDLVYNPIQSQLLKLGEKHHKPTANGLSMLVWQAVFAHKIWYGAVFSDKDITQIIKEVEAVL